MSFCFFPFAKSSHRAFSLIEVLVSMAILVLLLVMVVQILNGSVTVTGSSRKHLAADDEARAVLDRMAGDIDRMLIRKDVDYAFGTTGLNDAFFFYSEAPAFYTGAANSQQPVSLIGYRINSKFQLERLGLGLSWDGVPPLGFVALTPAIAPPVANAGASPTPTPDPASTIGASGSPFASIVGTKGGNYSDGTDLSTAAPSYHVLGDNVFRLEFVFLLKATATLPAIYSSLPYDTRIAGRTSLLGIGLGDVQAIVATIAILDPTSRRVLGTNEAQISSALGGLAARLPSPTSGNLSASSPSLPAKSWQDIVDGGSLGIPQAAAAQLRIYQRVFYLKTQ